MPLVDVILGGLLLLFGRSLYWAFVAVAGFLIGGQLAEISLAEQAAWLRLLAAIVAGAIGALLALLAQRVAFGVGGFFAGGYLAALLVRSLQVESNEAAWLVIGGVIGAVVALLVMDWAIIALSSLVGAGAIVNALALEPAVGAATFAILCVVGIIVQASRMRRAQRMPSRTG